MQNTASKPRSLGGIRFALTILVLFVTIPFVAGTPDPGGLQSMSDRSMSDKRAATCMGEDIGASKLIVIGHYKSEHELLVTEVLKGRKSYLGQILRFSNGKGPPYKVPNGIPRAVFFENDDDVMIWPQTKYYEDSASLTALRTLVKIYALPNEHERYTRLSQLFVSSADKGEKGGDQLAAIYVKEFYGALPYMREPQTFDVVKSSYAKVNSAAKLRLLEWMADTRDPRSLPVLIDALTSSDRFIKSEAETKIRYYWPSTPEGKAALQKVRASAPPTPPLTPFQKAEILSAAGKVAEARAQHFVALETNKLSPGAGSGGAASKSEATIKAKQVSAYVQRACAQKLLIGASDQDKTRIWQAIAAQMSYDARVGNYLEANEATEIMYMLQKANCLDDLIVLLDRRDPLTDKANRLATMAIIDLGPAARAKAVTHLMEQLKKTNDNYSELESRTTTLMQLALIGTIGDADRCTAFVADKPGLKSIWETLSKLYGVSDRRDQCIYLCDLMQAQPGIILEALPWIADKLGCLGDGRASDVLVMALNTGHYKLSDCAADALKRLGRKCNKAKIVGAALDYERYTQPQATGVLCTIYGAESLPVLRQIVHNSKVKYKNEALIWLGQFGTKEDLSYLLPMSDYWKGDRLNHYWVMQALGGIQQRESEGKL